MAGGEIDRAARRANAGPHATSLVQLRGVMARRPGGRGAAVREAPGTGAPVQRAVADDVAQMGLADELAKMLARSTRAKALVERADNLGVRVVHGGIHPHTDRAQGSNVLRVVIPPSEKGRAALSSILFELQNALRYHRIDALTARAVSGDIADEDEFAREKIKIELEGMLGTGRIALEHNRSEEGKQPGEKIPVTDFFQPTYLDYLGKLRQNPFLEREAYAASMADAVLDRTHGLGSHRQVYRAQFGAMANAGNRAARERNERLKLRAGQVASMSKLILMGPAVNKLWAETGDGPEVAAWLEHHRESSRWGALREAAMGPLADRLNAEAERGTLKEVLPRMGRQAVGSLYAWIKHTDDGRYQNLAQLLALFLGFYDEKPWLLATHWGALREVAMGLLADRLNVEAEQGKLEEVLPLMGGQAVGSLYAWIEHTEDGRYRNLVQLLALSLGFYNEKPGLLFTSVT
jgi:hypothetical protein